MKVKNLCFKHRRGAPYFFKDLSFDLEEGLIHALHGKNGVGKSVLLHILSDNIEKEAVVTGDIPTEKVILMHQQFDQTLVDRFTFLENLQFGSFERFPSPFARLKGAQKGILGLIEKFHIDVALPVYKLSGGQRQILALLMQLQRGPRSLLLDEPTAALDGQNATMVFDFLKALKGVTLLIVCHDQELINRYTTGRHLHMEVEAHGLRALK
jgi:ABC-2 type transport system ATP-binding protein